MTSEAVPVETVLTEVDGKVDIKVENGVNKHRKQLISKGDVQKTVSMEFVKNEVSGALDDDVEINTVIQNETTKNDTGQESEPSKSKTSNKTKHFFCSVCNKGFTKRPGLREHLRIHNDNRPLLNCRVCGKVLTTNVGIRKHEKSHFLTEKPFKCDKCECRFACPSSLKYHLATKHAPEPLERTEVCNICGKAFQTVENLKKHVLLHRERSYLCELCGKAFKKGYALKCHMTAIHSDITPYACQYCDQKFRKKLNLIAHIREHTGQQSYECQFCSAWFGSKSSLSKHINKNHKMQNQYLKEVEQSLVDVE
ncbi:gastrula zinc finger protein XlCGF7.1-like [Limulus polyphemus]|uniref:Gastrula zinc finger protein XlCGF7.1-like n=1 Tax=Limulus polyphemus TaxID=6850 RepID=A0ABM1SUG5_LIMPO|nr:gastrula zinc finger protein XlCGF7.1-like [Limulus polyphemus]XP_022247272.1 gastrula zinc finger protein XlCGF7.1-like [Limulus polyphemus]